MHVKWPGKPIPEEKEFIYYISNFLGLLPMITCVEQESHFCFENIVFPQKKTSGYRFETFSFEGRNLLIYSCGGGTGVEKRDGMIYADDDLVSPALSLFCLKEEIKDRHRDRFGLVEGRRSPRFKNERLNIPAVDNFAVWLSKALGLKMVSPWPGRFHVAVSCDADYLSYDDLKSAVRLLSEYGVDQPTFFVYGGTPDEATQFDPKYDIGAEENRMAVDFLKSASVEIAAHGGYLSFDSNEKLLKEREYLESIFKRRIEGYRAHFLRMVPPRTYYRLIQSGYSYDSSLGYPDCCGVRGGWLRPAPVFMPDGDPSQFFKLPVTLMDQNFHWPQENTLEEKKAVIKQMCEQAAVCNGVLTLDWHPHTIHENGNWWNDMKLFLSTAKESGASFSGIHTAISYISNSKAQPHEEECISMDNETKYYNQSQLWENVAEYQKNVLEDITRFMPGDVKTILDVGCGSGFVINSLSAKYDCTGLDISETALEQVKVKKIVGSADALPFPDNSFDLLMINDVLEHLPEPVFRKTLSELRRVTKKYILVTVPFMENLNAGMTCCGKCGTVYHITHHLRSFTPQVLIHLYDENPKPSMLIYSGTEHSIKDVIQYELRAGLHQYTRWESAMCPVCGSNASTQVNDDTAMSLYYEGVSEIPDDLPLQPPMRNECIAIFQKSPDQEEKPDSGIKLLVDGKEVLSFGVREGEQVLAPASYKEYPFLTFISNGIINVLPRAERSAGGEYHIPNWFNNRLLWGNENISESLLLQFCLLKQAKSNVRLVNLDNRAAALQSQIDQGNARFVKLDNADAALQSQIDQSNARFVKLDNTDAALQSQIDQSNARFVKLDNADAALQSQIDQGYARFVEQNTALDKRINVLQDQLAQSNARLAELEELLSTSWRQFLIRLWTRKSKRTAARSSPPIPAPARQILPWSTQRQLIEDLARPNIVAEPQKDDKRHFLVICHDQDIDRRIIQQIETLIASGWSGVIVALSFDTEDKLEEKNGYHIHRIGLKHIVPGCKVYWLQQRMQYWNNRFFSGFPLLPGIVSKVNNFICRVLSRLYYRCGPIKYPLPFDLAFFRAAEKYPADLILAEDLPALKASALLKRQWNCHLIFDSHEFYPEQNVFSARQKKIMHDVTKRFIGDCDEVITVSDGIAEKFADFYGIKKPHVIHNVTVMENTAKSNKFHALLKLSQDQIIVLYQGGIIPERNIENVLKGFLAANVANTHLVFLGPSAPQFLEKLKKIAGKALNNSIHFLEAVPREELLAYTASADFGVIPYKVIDLNTKYCMPNKFFEFIQAGLPILSNDLIEIEKILKKIGGGGMIHDLNSPGKAAEAIRVMLTRDLKHDHELLLSAREKLSWNTESKDFEKIIQQGMKA